MSELERALKKAWGVLICFLECIKCIEDNEFLKRFLNKSRLITFKNFLKWHQVGSMFQYQKVRAVHSN